MSRSRFATFAACAGLAFVCGCCALADRPLLGLNPFWWNARNRECCDMGTISEGETPPVETYGPSIPGPTTAPLAPQSNVPQLAPPPRLVPEPQSRTTPYTPQSQAKEKPSP